MLHLKRIGCCQVDSSDPMTAFVPMVRGFALLQQQQLQFDELMSPYCEIGSQLCPGANARRLSWNGLRNRKCGGVT